MQKSCDRAACTIHQSQTAAFLILKCSRKRISEEGANKGRPRRKNNPGNPTPNAPDISGTLCQWDGAARNDRWGSG
ncbi:hypothetical protein CEXT_214391 [Caerostris extrusa]|uniref:Uncharacterized protein n=1 Tax=Caerostris extrusa TaxID=172846 RepID=A0AAV4NAZ6_CAEEX|nr:hypothetical protein CEXT_214391 [Caerostris extrusa]